MKRQHIVHTYGDDTEYVDTDELQAELEQRIDDGSVPHHIPSSTGKPDCVEVVLGGKHCKCGSTTHVRTSHQECPLRGVNSASVSRSEKRCKCGSSTHLRTSHHDCPLRKN